MKRSRWFLLVAALTAFALVGAACGDDGGDTAGPGDDGPVDCNWTIGTMGALSGDAASLGEPISRGVDLAVKLANEAGDVPCELEVQKEDSQGNPEQAPALAQSLVENEELVACACPYFSGETLATGDIFTDAGVLISGTGTNETIDEQGFETWFRAVAPDNIQAEVAAAYLQEGLGLSQVAIVHDNQDYSKGLADGVAAELGDATVGTFVINPEEPDFSAVVAQVKDAAPDGIFYGGYTPQAGPLLRQLANSDVDVPFLSDDGAKDPSFGELAGAASEGAQVTCPCTDPLKQEAATAFVEAHEAEYGEPPGTFSADMFDVTNLIIEALKGLNGDEAIEDVRAAVIEQFDSADGYQGVAKAYSWEDNGEFEGTTADIWVYEWSDEAGDFVSLGPAAELLE
jgi:branched-chain amino acid transport system substrate-binding protein